MIETWHALVPVSDDVPIKVKFPEVGTDSPLLGDVILTVGWAPEVDCVVVGGTCW